MNKDEYEKYLRSPEWAAKKEAVWKRDKGTCQRCGRKYVYGDLTRFHTHHLTYERVGDEYLSDLQLLCEHCHEFVHGQSDYDPTYIPTIDELLEKIKNL